MPSGNLGCQSPKFQLFRPSKMRPKMPRRWLNEEDGLKAANQKVAGLENREATARLEEILYGHSLSNKRERGLASGGEPRSEVKEVAGKD